MPSVALTEYLLEARFVVHDKQFWKKLFEISNGFSFLGFQCHFLASTCIKARSGVAFRKGTKDRNNLNIS